MIKYEFSTTPQTSWDAQCQKQNSFFNSGAWQQVLHQGFNCDSLYIKEISGNTMFVINTFKAGPFRIGYLGFPTGTTLQGMLDQKHVEALRSAKLPIHLLRIPSSEFSNHIHLYFKSNITQETCIIDLPSWDLSKFKKLRRDIKKAEKSSLTIRELQSDDDGTILYQLYKSTIKDKGGTLRYTPKYFRELTRLCRTNNTIRVFTAYAGSEIAAYVIIALHSDTAFYLHGASASAHKQSGASDLLLIEAITWAKHSGKKAFNLMNSAAKQKGLIRYKEKFGGITKTHHTYEVTFNPVYVTLFHLASTATQVYRRIANKLSV